jgi:Zn-dependent protease/CBS domain-containing protein
MAGGEEAHMAASPGALERKGNIGLFKIAGIRITIDYSWFIIFSLILWSLSAGYFPREYPGQSAAAYWAAGAVSTILFFLSVVFHELSHSLMAMRTGINIPEITLFVFGGVSRLSQEPQDPLNEFKIAVVGPLSSFFLAAVFGAVRTILQAGGYPLITEIFGYLAWINVALGGFNLIPGFPLDGGRVLRAILWWRTGSLARATKWASDMGKGFAVALMVLGGLQIFAGMLIGGLWLLFIGIFLRGIAEGGYQELMVRQSLEGVHVREVMITEVVSVSPDLVVNRLVGDYFLRYGYKGFPVAKAGKTLGVVSLADVKDIAEEEYGTKTVGEIMTPAEGGVRIGPDDSLAEAFKRMSQQEDMGRLLVMDGDNLAGMITKTGLIRFLEIKRILDR